MSQNGRLPQFFWGKITSPKALELVNQDPIVLEYYSMHVVYDLETSLKQKHPYINIDDYRYPKNRRVCLKGDTIIFWYLC